MHRGILRWIGPEVIIISVTVLQDMREQADRVEEAFSRRIAETEEATRSLESELKQVRQ